MLACVPLLVNWDYQAVNQRKGLIIPWTFFEGMIFSSGILLQSLALRLANLEPVVSTTTCFLSFLSSKFILPNT